LNNTVKSVDCLSDAVTHKGKREPRAKVYRGNDRAHG